MRRAIATVVLAATTVILTTTMAMADATYPPHPHNHPIPPGPPTAFTGAEISKPLLAMVGLVLLGALVLLAALLFTAKDADSR